MSVAGRVRFVAFLTPEAIATLEELAEAYRCSRSDVLLAAIAKHQTGGLRDEVLRLKAGQITLAPNRPPQ